MSITKYCKQDLALPHIVQLASVLRFSEKFLVDEKDMFCKRHLVVIRTIVPEGENMCHLCF